MDNTFRIGAVVRNHREEWRTDNYVVVEVTAVDLVLRRPDSSTKSGFRTHRVSHAHAKKHLYLAEAVRG